MDHDLKLSEYTAIAYNICIGDMIELMIERGIKAVVSVLKETKNHTVPLHLVLSPLM